MPAIGRYLPQHRSEFIAWRERARDAVMNYRVMFAAAELQLGYPEGLRLARPLTSV